VHGFLVVAIADTIPICVVRSVGPSELVVLAVRCFFQLGTSIGTVQVSAITSANVRTSRH